MKKRDVFNNISPIDYRYWDEELAKYLSENGFTRYKLLVELALIKVLHRRDICPKRVVKEVEAACGRVTTAEVYKEEKRIRHDVRALVNCIREKVSKKAKPFVHMTATSYDIIDSANAARYRDVTLKVLVPALVDLEMVLIDLAIREAETIQIGRTHGQHAVPITFGFAISGYVSRLGNSIEALKALAKELPGKFSGAVGAYNASSLFFENPELFEAEILSELGLVPPEHSTQVVPPESLTRLLCEVVITSGILANLADDMRHLQRTEIGEVGEEVTSDQVASSTMPHKPGNPVNFENAKSCWKIVMPRILTVFMDQISEHQRDLTNSASGRTYGEMIAYVCEQARRLEGVMRKLKVDSDGIIRNFELRKDLIVGEPLYIILAALGHPDAHEKVRKLTLSARQKGEPLGFLAEADPELKPYFKKMTTQQRKIILDSTLYTGIADRKAIAIAEHWKRRLGL